MLTNALALKLAEPEEDSDGRELKDTSTAGGVGEAVGVNDDVGVAVVERVEEDVAVAVHVDEGVDVVVRLGELVGLGVRDGVIEGVAVSVVDGEEPTDSEEVGDGEHESGTERPVVVHPHAHGNGATDASGQ